MEYRHTENIIEVGNLPNIDTCLLTVGGGGELWANAGSANTVSVMFRLIRFEGVIYCFAYSCILVL